MEPFEEAIRAHEEACRAAKAAADAANAQYRATLRYRAAIAKLDLSAPGRLEQFNKKLREAFDRAWGR